MFLSVTVQRSLKFSKTHGSTTTHEHMHAPTVFPCIRFNKLSFTRVFAPGGSQQEHKNRQISLWYRLDRSTAAGLCAVD